MSANIVSNLLPSCIYYYTVTAINFLANLIGKNDAVRTNEDKWNTLNLWNDQLNRIVIEARLIGLNDENLATLIRKRFIHFKINRNKNDTVSSICPHWPGFFLKAKKIFLILLIIFLLISLLSTCTICTRLAYRFGRRILFQVNI